ncbi:MAG: glycosyltransferase [Chloroflexota bacterium]
MHNTQTPSVALIIPSLNGEVGPLLETARRQTLPPVEIEIVRGVRPNGRARNQGVARTTAPILVFVDDDAMLGNEQVIANLVAPLLTDPTIGVTGASKLLPPDAGRFQRWVAREVPRVVHPVVQTALETNPDPPAYYCEITTTCCAMRREVFEQSGGFDESLVRGVDTEFFVRIRRMHANTEQPPYRFILVPHTWTYHPAPTTVWALMRKQFLYGLGHAQEVRHDPTRARGRMLKTPLHTVGFLFFRTAIIIPNIFLPYSFAAPSWRPGFKPLKALASYVSALGYVWGWYKTD